jgi:hypothetical protein
MLAILNEAGVDYVLIGGFAARIRGSPYVTTDVDVTPSAGRDNLHRLSAALGLLDARIRTDDVPDGLPFDHDGDSLAAATVWNLTTRHGDLDLSLVPSGTTGYDDLVRDGDELELLGVVVKVASLADVVRSKAAAARAKDRAQLPLLRRLLEEDRPDR